MDHNLLDALPNSLPEELVTNLVASANVRIERIVSTGHRNPDGFWYNQSECEWVLLLKGEAVLRFEDGATFRRMQPGDHVFIPPRKKHRVEWTSSNEPTVWLAVFFVETEPQTANVDSSNR